MKIDFEHLKVFTDISHKNSEVVNIKEQIADLIYKNSNGIAYHALAMKIYNSQGDCELTEREYALLKGFVNERCIPQVIDAFLQYEEQV